MYNNYVDIHPCTCTCICVCMVNSLSPLPNAESKESFASLQLPKLELRKSLQPNVSARKTSSSQDHGPLSANKLSNGLKLEPVDSSDLQDSEGGMMVGEPELKSKATIDLMEEKAVQIDASCPLDSIFASDEEDEGQEVTHPPTVIHVVAL